MDTDYLTAREREKEEAKRWGQKMQLTAQALDDGEDWIILVVGACDARVQFKGSVVRATGGNADGRAAI